MASQDIKEDKAVAESAAAGWRPRIVAFCCHYCAYTAADLAGAARLQYSPSVEIVRLPCTGKVDAVTLLAAFAAGADGVYVAGCLDGDCHFIEGNIRAKARIAAAKKLLAEVGLEPERLEMFQLSAAEGDRFRQIADEMTARIAKMGRSPVARRAKGLSTVTLSGAATTVVAKGINGEQK